MPIYEYQCEKCRKVSNFLVRDVTKHKPPACPKCGHPKMSRLFSRFSASRGVKNSELAGASAPPASGGEGDMPDLSALDGLDENDPRSLGGAMRKMAEDAGEPMPPEMDEMVRRLESGEDPEKIEDEMGDALGDEGGAPDGAGDDTLYEG